MLTVSLKFQIFFFWFFNDTTYLEDGELLLILYSNTSIGFTHKFDILLSKISLKWFIVL